MVAKAGLGMVNEMLPGAVNFLTTSVDGIDVRR